MSAFSIPKQSPRSVDSSRALQLAAVDSTNCSSPRVVSRTPDSSGGSPTNSSSYAISSNCIKQNEGSSDSEKPFTVSRSLVKEEKYRPVKASSSRPGSCKEAKVWRPY